MTGVDPLVNQPDPTLQPPGLVALAAVVGAALGAVVCVILPSVPWWFGLAFGVVPAWWVSRRLRSADGVVLDELDVREPSVSELARLDNLLDGLSLAAGLEVPDIVVIDAPGLNAAAVTAADRSSVVVTTGLLGELDRIELEAVAAELLVRIGSGQAERFTAAAATVGIELVDRGGPLRSLGTELMRRLVGGDGDVDADTDAVRLTRYPPGLIGALAKMDQLGSSIDVVTDGTAHLWIGPSVSEPPVARPELECRLDILGEL